MYNAARDYATRSKRDQKLAAATALLGGTKIDQIIGQDRGEGWSFRLSSYAELAVKINHAAQRLANEGDTQTVDEGGIAVTLTLTGGLITASLTVDGETRPVENFAKPKDEVRTAMEDALLALYDSFAENRNDGSTYGRHELSQQISHCKEFCADDFNTKNSCTLRTIAARLLETKAGVSAEQIAMLTNSQLTDLARTLCRTGDVHAVNEAAASAVASSIEFNKKFGDVSALLEGKSISEIVGDNRDAGWEEKAGDLAELAVKINRASLTITRNGASTEVRHGDFTVVLKVKDGRMEACLKSSAEERAIGSVIAEREFLCIAMDGAVAALYDSFTDKKDGDLTYGRALLSGKVLAYYKELSKASMETKDNCASRTFAADLLKTKAVDPQPLLNNDAVIYP